MDSSYEDDNYDEVVNKPTGISLSEKQLEEFNKKNTPEEKAELLHRWFYAIHQDMDKELKDKIKESLNYDKVNDLYWNMIDHCEEYGYPLFNKLNTSILYEFMFSKTY